MNRIFRRGHILGLFVLGATLGALAPLPGGSEGLAQDRQLSTANHVIPSLRERVRIMQRWIEWKLQNVLPAVMREQGIDLFIVRNDEGELFFNNEGPVYSTLIPANAEGLAYGSEHERDGSQRMPRYLAFHATESGITYVEPRDYDSISALVTQLDPQTIAIGDYLNDPMLEALGPYAERAVSSWTLGVRWLETMAPDQIEVLKLVQGVANDIIAEGFSNRVVIPGVTTTDDLNWWFRERMADLHLEYENHPSIGIQRKPENIAKYDDPPEYFRDGRSRNGMTVTVQRGDIVSCDSDIMMLGLVTDSHQHAYVLELGETEVPPGLVEALAKVNRMQDLFRAEFVAGRTGKEIVAAADRIPREAGVLRSQLGFHPPPTFLRRYQLGGYMLITKPYVAGMTSGPGYYPTSIVTNDHRLYAGTLYAFEPHTSVAVDGWGEQGVELGIGQIAWFDGKELRYLDRPQESQWHVIR
ncbi:MAG TPA: hypothetical protein QGG47_14010 [Acidobacteriota bacterium]|nr:hypothetical protein [Acidobacteriota bacterium]